MCWHFLIANLDFPIQAGLDAGIQFTVVVLNFRERA